MDTIYVVFNLGKFNSPFSSSLPFSLYLSLCVLSGEEAAGSRAKDQGRGVAAKGKVRAGADRDQQVQPGVHRGHELSIHQVPRDGGDAAALLQGGPLLDPQGPQRVAEPEPAADLRGVLPHGEQRRSPEGPQVVVQQSRR